MVSFGRGVLLLSFQTSFTRTQLRQSFRRPTSSSPKKFALLPLSPFVLLFSASHPLALGPYFTTSTSCLAQTTSSTMDTPSNNTVYNRNGAPETGFLNAKDAYELDQRLFNGGYTLEQLMELAGLSVAQAVYECVPFHMDHQAGPSSSFAPPSILVSFLVTTLQAHCLILCFCN
jgi:Uncharacterized conserved protein